jgi:hypothetical protein
MACFIGFSSRVRLSVAKNENEGVEVAASVDLKLGALARTGFFGVPGSAATTKPKPKGK